MLFETAVQTLCDAGVEFVVIGGLAATLHGSATVTFDLDICYSRVPENLKKLADALAPFHLSPPTSPQVSHFSGIQLLFATPRFRRSKPTLVK
jgi:hypothetical protein